MSRRGCDFDAVLRIALLGDSNAGKDKILSGLGGQSFDQPFGLDCVSKIIECSGRRIKMHITDTGGQERFNGITSFRGAHGFVFLYNTSAPQSFQSIKNVLRNIAHENPDSNRKCILLGYIQGDASNKAVDVAAGEALAEQYNMPFYEVSATDKINLEEAFMHLSKNILIRVNERKSKRLQPSVQKSCRLQAALTQEIKASSHAIKLIELLEGVTLSPDHKSKSFRDQDNRVCLAALQPYQNKIVDALLLLPRGMKEKYLAEALNEGNKFHSIIHYGCNRDSWFPYLSSKVSSPAAERLQQAAARIQDEDAKAEKRKVMKEYEDCVACAIEIHQHSRGMLEQIQLHIEHSGDKVSSVEGRLGIQIKQPEQLDSVIFLDDCMKLMAKIKTTKAYLRSLRPDDFHNIDPLENDFMSLEANVQLLASLLNKLGLLSPDQFARCQPEEHMALDTASLSHVDNPSLLEEIEEKLGGTGTQAEGLGFANPAYIEEHFGQGPRAEVLVKLPKGELPLAHNPAYNPACNSGLEGAEGVDLYLQVGERVPSHIQQLPPSRIPSAGILDEAAASSASRREGEVYPHIADGGLGFFSGRRQLASPISNNAEVEKVSLASGAIVAQNASPEGARALEPGEPGFVFIEEEGQEHLQHGLVQPKKPNVVACNSRAISAEAGESKPKSSLGSNKQPSSQSSKKLLVNSARLPGIGSVAPVKKKKRKKKSQERERAVVALT